MLYFESDYTEGAHETLLKRLCETSRESLSSYGADKYSESAREKIRSACNAPDADIYFLVGGTQTNSTVIGAMLSDCEGVISAESGHIALHEAGAVEYTGHKVLTLPAHEGKIAPDELSEYLAGFYADANHSHMVYPGMVYISHPTEYGTLYSKAELTRLHEICAEYEISLYMDGARLGYGLMSRDTDVSLEDIAQLCDVFYIGGTKVGALCGEALVFPKNNAPKHFMTLVKQHGALLAKGRLTGVQFDALFTDGLYYALGKNAIDCAEDMKDVFRRHGMRFFLESPTNQQFIILENSEMERLSENVRFSFWEKYDDEHTVVRFCTSWITERESVALLDMVLGGKE